MAWHIQVRCTFDLYLILASIFQFPGIVIPSEVACSVARGGRQHYALEYEVLVGTGTWAKADALNIPKNAIFGGECEQGEVLYIGRVKHEGHEITGKVEPSTGFCFITYNNKVHAYDRFEVLVPSENAST